MTTSNLKRPSWDQYFMRIAEEAATRSTCCRRQVGAVVVRDRAILATGYNGAPAGTRHCGDTGCLRQEMSIPSGQRNELCRGSHAEMNAIALSAKAGINISGSTIYCTHQPCSMCTKLLINAGVVRVVYQDQYHDPLGQELMDEAGSVYEYLHLPKEGRGAQCQGACQCQHHKHED